jgi:23S rRNA pseudouridine1911/1915/1917 synthase
MLVPLVNNHQFIVLNKPAGIGVQPDKTGAVSLQQQASAFCKSQLWVVHRVDLPVTGLVVYAKSANAARSLSEQFSQRKVLKTYLAVVAGTPPQDEGTLVHYLKKNGRNNITEAFNDPQPDAEQAELTYRVVGRGDRYSLLEIKPLTGRHHQIRVQLAAIGCPIKGDVKYGAKRSNPDRSIHLHAWKLAFEHPVSGEPVMVEAPCPTGDKLWELGLEG